jgi:Photosystem II reaction centre X protein (PsbX)
MTSSLNNFLLSLVAGGVLVVLPIGLALIFVSNFDPVKRTN